MARDPAHDILFEPVRIGPKTIRNRFYQVPHCTGFGTEKPWSQAAHRGIKAEGGWGCVSTEYCSISPESDEWPFVSARLWDDGDVRALRLMTDAAHDHGALAAVELWHGGVHAECRESRLAPLSPSGISSQLEPGLVPRAMTVADIARVQDEWVAAALRARDAGFDVIYVYGSHGYLPTQFLSPLWNRRQDAYGGSFENRARFWLETIERVRAAIGDTCAIAVRIAADALGTAGVEPDEGLAFIRAADHLVDLWDMSIGTVAGEGRLDAGPSRFYRQGYQLELGWPARAREATAKPVVGVGCYVDPDVMAQVIHSGVQDLIGGARPSIADPFLPRKIEEGRYDEIRACIGCNACYIRSVSGRHLGCTQNATAGEEHRRGWHPERFERARNADRQVLVVGGGAAGLEAAITLAKRGFEQVTVVERDAQPGGLMRTLPTLPGLGDWGRLLTYRERELERFASQITIGCGQEISVAEVRAADTQLVIVATGARWSETGVSGMTSGEPIAGADARTDPAVLTPDQLFAGAPVPDGEVVVVDADGYFLAASVAERLALEGRRVTLATAFEIVAPLCDHSLEGIPLRRRLHQVGVNAVCGHVARELRPDGVRATDAHGGEVVLPAAAVVLVTQRFANDTLYHDLCADEPANAAAGIEQVLRCGDCLGPRLLPDAIFDGHRLAREIDGDDPMRAVPYRRERATV